MLERTEGSLLQRLAKAIEQDLGLRIKNEEWQPEKLPAWLNARVVIQEDAKQDRKPTKVLPQSEHFFFMAEFDGRKVSVDNYPQLPEQYCYQRSGLDYRAYPGLCDVDDEQYLCLYHDKDYAREHTALAASNLVRQGMSALLNGLRRRLITGNKQRLHLSTVPAYEQFVDDCVKRIGAEACAVFEQAPADATAFVQALATGKRCLGEQEQEWQGYVERLLLQHYNLTIALKDVNKSQHSYLLDDVAVLREALLYKGFMMRTPKQWLWHYPRYLQAAAYRLERYRQLGARDAELQSKLDVWQQRLQGLAPGDTQQRMFWMLQEYRVSLFAQQLKTSIPVSETRLRQLWERAQS